MLSILLMLLLSTSGAVLAAGDPILPAKAYLLMDAVSGRVLHEYQGSLRLPVASTTKVMTAIVALERGKLSDLVTVGRRPYETPGSTIFLEIGEQISLENLLYGLMLESANDAGVAIAEHLAGTEEEFARWMNEKAAAIGARDTNFVNSHGLHHDEHYSTAHDLALMARYGLQNPEFRRIIETETRDIPGSRPGTVRHLQNRNQLLGYYPGANGVKNGFTEEAELTNIASARREEMELIAVVLGARIRLWTSSMALLDFGFSHFRSELLAQKGDPAGLLAPPEEGAEPVAGPQPAAGEEPEEPLQAGPGGPGWAAAILMGLLLLAAAVQLTFTLHRLRVPMDQPREEGFR